MHAQSRTVEKKSTTQFEAAKFGEAALKATELSRARTTADTQEYWFTSRRSRGLPIHHAGGNYSYLARKENAQNTRT